MEQSPADLTWQMYNISNVYIGLERVQPQNLPEHTTTKLTGANSPGHFSMRGINIYKYLNASGWCGQMVVDINLVYSISLSVNVQSYCLMPDYLHGSSVVYMYCRTVFIRPPLKYSTSFIVSKFYNHGS